MDNSNKIILDLCGGTGSWSKPYKDAGYDVQLITLPQYDVLTYQPPSSVYGILAAPPCTEFSIAKGAAPHDWEKGLTTVRACLEIIWKCRSASKLKFWCMENQTGFLRQFLGMPVMRFEQWQFEGKYIKPTDLWGYFNKPTPVVKLQPSELTVKIGKRTNSRDWGSPKKPKEYEHLKLDRAAIRAITPPGFAQAFYKANK